MKLLTISIAAYNVSGTIRRALDSMLEREDKRLEVIVVDDGSKDETAAIVSEYVEKYPETVRLISKQNGGYGSTITASLAAAEGRYYKIVDGDDWVQPAELSRLLDCLEAAEADLVLMPFLLCNEGTGEEKLIRRHGLATDVIRLEEAPIEDGLAIFEVAIRTEALRRKHPEYLEHCFYTDNEYVMAVDLCAKNVQSFDGAVSCYRIGSDEQSVSLAGKRRHCSDTFLVSERVYQMFAEDRANLEGTRKLIVEKLVSSMARLTYISVLVQNNPVRMRRDLKAYDSDSADICEEIYEITGRSKLVRFARSCSSLMFWALSRIIIKKESTGTPW